ncbi:hypothetical protein BDB00DRAFT_927457 [Zychaea mexicana]|uniref:uncharacterized protein n=1 Tax=Zychaea mexicana TaxID=64656 RepID=UPI0022FF42CE|nr:uncharacterized protein BDB00DRAFT_927457 [Zychaea mexicana]KAI9495567.1 hypothetical protein BDB00DRAFT_927457 [Zychaea mexicana]
MQNISDRSDETSARCLKDYVHFVEENYDKEGFLREFYTFGGWELEERSIAEKQFQAVVGSLLTQPQHTCYSWALEIVTDRYAILNSTDTEKYWGERAIAGEVIRRTEEGVAKTSQQLFKRKTYDLRDRNSVKQPPQQKRRHAEIEENDGLHFDGLDSSLMTVISKKAAKEETETVKGRYKKAISMNNVIDVLDTLKDGQLHTAIKDDNIINMIIESLSFDPKIKLIQCSDMTMIVKDIDSNKKVKRALKKIYNNLVNSKGSQALVTRLFCHVGDTVPENFKGKNNQQIKPRKMDLRLMCMATDVGSADLGVGEFAKSIQSTKYLTDKAKMIVCNKAQLNTFVKILKPTEEDIKELALPMVQIMGLQAEVSTIRLVSSGAYVIQKVRTCTLDGDPTKLPTSMESVVQLLHCVKMLATRVKYKLESFTKCPNRKASMESFTTANTTNDTSTTSWIRIIKETGLSE